MSQHYTEQQVQELGPEVVAEAERLIECGHDRHTALVQALTGDDHIPVHQEPLRFRDVKMDSDFDMSTLVTDEPALKA